MNKEILTALTEKNKSSTEGVLRDFRETHLALFKKKGLMEVTQDSYKFSKPENFLNDLILNNESGEIDQDLKTNFPTITFLNGAFSSAENMPEGVSLRQMREHFHEMQTLLKEDNAFSNLHHSLTFDGVILEVAPKKEITTPVRILHIITKASVSAPTNIIIAGPLSKMTVIEETRAADISHAVIGETYILARESSNIEHIALDEESSEGLTHNSIFAEVERDATVRSLIFHGRGKKNRRNLTLNLNAAGSHGESYCLFLTNGQEHSDINTAINHKAADSTSNQIAKGILDGDSKGVFTGKIHIFPKAQRVSSGQLNKNLLLSKKAQVHSQPQLEIFADDVKCSHGSTTGQLSDDEVFYFQARGIPEDKARNLLALGFALEIVQKIENKEAKAHVSAVIMENLASKFSLRGLL